MVRHAVSVHCRVKINRVQSSGFILACQRAGLEGVTPHTLRHTAATWMAQAGTDLFAVAGFLGQNPMTTVRVYAKHSPDYLKKALAALEG